MMALWMCINDDGAAATVTASSDCDIAVAKEGLYDYVVTFPKPLRDARVTAVQTADCSPIRRLKVERKGLRGNQIRVLGNRQAGLSGFSRSITLIASTDLTADLQTVETSKVS